MPRSNRDRMFLYVLMAALFVLIMFGIGSVILALATEEQDATVIARVIGAFQSMFGATIAFGVGYLVGHNGNNKEKNNGVQR